MSVVMAPPAPAAKSTPAAIGGRLTAAIFDVDGVLLASPHERAWREALAGYADPDRFTTAVYQAQVAGLKLLPDGLAFDPHLPAGWITLTFRCQWRGRCLQIRVDQRTNTVVALLEAGKPMTLVVQGKLHDLRSDKPLQLDLGPRVKPEI